MLKPREPKVFSFEPVRANFNNLVEATSNLKLEKYIHPIPSALSDKLGYLPFHFSQWDSMMTRVNISNETSSIIHEIFMKENNKPSSSI